MTPIQEVLSMRLERPDPVAPEGAWTPRLGSEADLDRVLEVDAACFDDFWRFDRPTLKGLLSTERLRLVEDDGGTVSAYTLSSVSQRTGVLGRIAVHPAVRRKGLGRSLLLHTVASMAREGANSVVLCTQAENEDSKALYRSVGFQEEPERLAMLISDTLGATDSPKTGETT